ncbi:MAG: hypothetical protein EOP77_01015, partial [Variovorax sp.]
MGSLVFVVAEVHACVEGETANGLFNMLRALSADDRKRAALCLVDDVIDPNSLDQAFPDIRLYPIDTRIDQDGVSAGRQHPPAKAYSATHSHWRSAVVFRALAALDDKSAIDYVEFPDCGGLAFCTLQERNLRGFLDHATIAVRIGMSQTQLMGVEAHDTLIEHLHLSDLERKCLRDCDRIVTPLFPVAEATRRSFGIPEEEWGPRLVEHAPWVHAGTRPTAPRAVDASFDQTLVFPSILRRVNRPDLFARAVGGFLRTQQSYTGAIVFGTPGIEPAYQSGVERLIPIDCRARV